MRGSEHLHCAASSLRAASRSLEAAVSRLELLLVGGAQHHDTALWLFTAISLRSLLETQVEPARRTLEALVLPPDVEDRGWGSGPWQAFDLAGRELRDLAERLRTAVGSDAGEGSPTAGSLGEMTQALQEAALVACRVRDRLEEPALVGLAVSHRLAPRLLSMAKQGERWQAELREHAAERALGQMNHAVEPVSHDRLTSWLDAVEGSLASFISTLRRLATEAPPEVQPSCAPSPAGGTGRLASS